MVSPENTPEEASNERAVQSCIREINTGTSSVYAACKKYGIPRSTIRYRMSDKWHKTTKRGPGTVLSKEEEEKIFSWLIGMQHRGFPVQRRSLLFKVKDFLTANPRDTPFKNNCAGKKWFSSFMIRHPQLSIRTPEAVTSASARVTEGDIRKWFKEVSTWMDLEGIKDIMSDPSRVFNGDETSFYLHPKTREVIAQKGSRNVYEVEQADGKQNITVMFSFSASGHIVDPLVILPGQRIRKAVAQAFPSAWGLGQSHRGWMTTHNFSEYIRQIFHPFLIRHGIQLPVIFFVDGHSSHVAVEVADLCQHLGIVLIALYPNTTRIIQPADVSIFKPLKDQWKKEVDDWRSEHPGELFTVRQFGSVLEKAVSTEIKQDSITNGFRVCGLYPFNADNVDYSKCIAVTDCQKTVSNNTNVVFSEGSDNSPRIDESTSSECPIPATSTVPAEDIEIESMVFYPPLFPESSGLPVESYTKAPAADQLLLPQPDASPTLRMECATHSMTFTLSSYVSIHTDEIKRAIELMGSSTLSKIIEGTDQNSTHEQKIIRYFYQEFIQPYVNIHTVPLDRRMEQDPVRQMSQSEGGLCLPRTITRTEIEGSNGNGCYSETNQHKLNTTDQSVYNDTTVLGELTISTDGDVSFNGDCSQAEVVRLLVESSKQVSSNDIGKTMNDTDSSITEPIIKQSQPETLQDVTNKRTESRKTSISDFLKLPPVPRRTGKHRNYTKKFHPVLTAGERLEEIRKVEKEKQDIEQKKKMRAIERENIKLQQLEAKQRKDEERKKKKMDVELQKRKKAKSKLKRPRKSANQDKDKKSLERGKKRKTMNNVADYPINNEKEN